MAGHVEQCARHGDAFAIDILRRAGEETSRRAPRSAAPWFAAAVRLLPAEPPSPERVGLLMSLAAAEAAIGRFSEAHAALAECVALVSDEDVELRVGLVVATAEIEQLLGRHNEARVRLQRAYEELTDRDSPARVSLLIALSTNSLYLADHRGMLDWGRLAVDAADKVGSETLAAASLAACAMGATFAGRVDLARDLHGRAVRLVDSLADDELLSRLDALSNLATAELYLDLHALTCAHGERGLSLARSTGRTQLVPILIPILGCSLWMTGELERSAEVLDEAIEGARLVDNAQGLSLALFNRALSAVMAGDLETGLQMGAESVELARTVDDGVITAFAGAIHAQVLCEAGEPEQAVELLLESVGGEDIPLLAGSWRATYFELLTRCCLELGQVDDARAAAQKVREQAEEQGLQLSGLMADRAGAAVALADGRPEDATALALSAVARSEEIGARVHAATSRALAGRALSAAGRSDEAIAQLVRAADAFDELGASRYRDQVEAQLRGLGKTIRRRTRRGRNDGSGMELLTGRELEVAELLCDHLTNREIAGELFLSLKTIEAHMRSIFQKLGVSSRREVAELVAQARRAGSGA
jgi:ATP/maltotriose-dependent transcriptional regulator MalT